MRKLKLAGSKSTPGTKVKAKPLTKKEVTSTVRRAAKAEVREHRPVPRPRLSHDPALFVPATPSGPVRMGRRLSPIVLDRVPNSYTDRDSAFLRQLHEAFGKKPFQRRNFDGGLMSRLIGHGYLKHVAGSLDEETATFQITPQGTARV